MRVVLDTNILVRANPKARPSGLARELLSPPILAETDRLLRYSHVKARWPLSEDAIRTYLALLEDSAFMAALPPEMPAIVSDPDDDPILQTAILGRADVLCSRDAAFRAAAVDEVCRAHGVRVLDDIALRHELRRLPE